LPPAGAVRTEELVNYFRFAYPQPSGTDPFSITTDLAECPWNPKHAPITVARSGVIPVGERTCEKVSGRRRGGIPRGVRSAGRSRGDAATV